MKARLFLLIILGICISQSCTDKFEEYNTDEKHPKKVTADVIFTKAQIDLANQISSTNVNDNIWKLIAQYWTERSYRDEANYNIVNRKIADGMFQTYYSILKELNEAKNYIKEETVAFDYEEIVKQNKTSIIELIEVFIYQRLVDTFGDIPYSEALSTENFTPKYDDAQEIYTSLIEKATKATNNLNPAQKSFGSADLIYSGDINSWIKFGNSLLVKLGIGVADGPLASLAQTTVENAYNNVISAPEEGAFFPYQSSLPYVNELHVDLVLSGRSDFIITEGIFNLMKGMNDPRIDNYFENLDGNLIIYGTSGGKYSDKVHFNSEIAKPDFPGFILTFEEIEFYLAEAAARGWNVGAKTAEDHFNEAVKASIISWKGTEAEATTFLANHPYNSYSGWKEAIGTQAWVSMYTRGFVGYTFYRRLDFPTVLIMPPNPPVGVDRIITRFTYPINEQTLNKANYTAASEAIGGDLMTTKLFWDVN